MNNHTSDISKNATASGAPASGETVAGETVAQAERVRRLRFRSWHRGTREMDLIMGRFADAELESCSPGQLDQYEALLEENDPDIYNWITGRDAPPAHVDNEMLRTLAARIGFEGAIG